MTRRRALYAAGALAITLCFIGVAVLYVTRTEAERAFNRIKIGMTPAEVELALGSPPRRLLASIDLIASLPTDRKENGIPMRDWGARDDVSHSEFWAWQDFIIIVAYDKSDKVMGYYLSDYRPPLWERVKQLVGW